jgi:hypothetical protein
MESVFNLVAQCTIVEQSHILEKKKMNFVMEQS